MKEYAADGVGDRTAPRFTGDQNLPSASAQPFGQQADLGGFAAALNSFKGYEK
jgi:hypothetical protein